MATPSRRIGLTITDFLDIALLGAIVLAAGYSLATVRASAGSTLLGPLSEALVSFQGTAPVPEAFGFLMLVAGSVMILAGPLWYAVWRPLARRGYV